MCRAKESAGRLSLGAPCNLLQWVELCICVEKWNGGQPGTSPGNLYPAVMWTWNFCWRNPLDFELRVQSFQISAELSRVLVLDALQPQSSRCLHIFEDVVDENC